MLVRLLPIRKYRRSGRFRLRFRALATAWPHGTSCVGNFMFHDERDHFNALLKGDEAVRLWMKLRSLDALPGDYDGPRLVEHLHLTMAHNEAVGFWCKFLSQLSQHVVSSVEWLRRREQPPRLPALLPISSRAFRT